MESSRRNHPNEPFDESAKCTICGIVFDSQAAALQHRRTVHRVETISEEDTSVLSSENCNPCSISFSHSPMLRFHHQDYHSDSYSYQDIVNNNGVEESNDCIIELQSMQSDLEKEQRMANKQIALRQEMKRCVEAACSSGRARRAAACRDNVAAGSRQLQMVYNENETKVTNPTTYLSWCGNLRFLGVNANGGREFGRRCALRVKSADADWIEREMASWPVNLQVLPIPALMAARLQLHSLVHNQYVYFDEVDDWYYAPEYSCSIAPAPRQCLGVINDLGEMHASSRIKAIVVQFNRDDLTVTGGLVQLDSPLYDDLASLTVENIRNLEMERAARIMAMRTAVVKKSHRRKHQPKPIPPPVQYNTNFMDNTFMTVEFINELCAIVANEVEIAVSTNYQNTGLQGQQPSQGLGVTVATNVKNALLANQMNSALQSQQPAPASLPTAVLQLCRPPISVYNSSEQQQQEAECHAASYWNIAQVPQYDHHTLLLQQEQARPGNNSAFNESMLNEMAEIREGAHREARRQEIEAFKTVMAKQPAQQCWMQYQDRRQSLDNSLVTDGDKKTEESSVADEDENWVELEETTLRRFNHWMDRDENDNFYMLAIEAFENFEVVNKSDCESIDALETSSTDSDLDLV